MKVLRQLALISLAQNPTQLSDQIGEREKGFPQSLPRLRLSSTTRREPEMKTGAHLLPFS